VGRYLLRSVPCSQKPDWSLQPPTSHFWPAEMKHTSPVLRAKGGPRWRVRPRSGLLRGRPGMGYGVRGRAGWRRPSAQQHPYGRSPVLRAKRVTAVAGSPTEWAPTGAERRKAHPTRAGGGRRDAPSRDVSGSGAAASRSCAGGRPPRSVRPGPWRSRSRPCGRPAPPRRGAWPPGPPPRPGPWRARRCRPAR
jgi:hypothetical protein